MAKRKTVEPSAETNSAAQPNASAQPPNMDSPELVPAQTEPQRAACEPGAASKRDAEDIRIERITTLPAIVVPRTNSGHARRTLRLRPFAVTVAVAAALGGMAGSLSTFGLAQWLTPADTGEAGALVRTVTRIDNELSALKATVEYTGKTTNAQFAHIVDRLEHNERTLAEPVAKLDKIGASLERLERRLPVTAATLPVPQTLPAPPAPEVTGTVLADARVPLPPEPRRSPVLDGWVLHSVFNGAAVVKGRVGLVQVEPGDRLPGLGRVETIRRQDGRWVVVTSRGLIVAR
jgi:hypothetical protein